MVYVQKLFLVLHILSAIAGLGPSFALPILGMTVGRNPETAVTLAPVLVRVAKLPRHGGLGALLTGVILVGMADLALFTQFWIYASVVLVAVALVLATTQSAPRLDQLAAMVQSGPIEPGKVRALLAPVGKIGRINMVLILVIVILMVFKPEI